MNFLTFKEDGTLLGRYTSHVHGANIPSYAIEVSDELFEKTNSEYDGVWQIADGVISKQPFAIQAIDFSALIAEERYRREGLGITVDGVSIGTGRDEQGLISGAALSAVIDPNYTCNWKTDAGFIELKAPQLLALATSVRAYVQACFDRELELLTLLPTPEFDEQMIFEGWPSTVVVSTATAVPEKESDV